jgi:hypothetical protein
MRTLLLLLVALLTAREAAAEPIGVVVHGQAEMQPELRRAIERWLTAHHFEVVSSPMPVPAVALLTDCFVIEDEACARSVVEQHAKPGVVVFARLDSSPGGDIRNTMILLVYWFRKGEAPSVEREYCEHCSEQVLQPAIEGAMAKLVKTAAKGTSGRVKITSVPAGAEVRVDDQAIGVTPLEYDLAPGPHKIVLAAPGHEPDAREIVIAGGQTKVIDATLVQGAARSHARSKLPWIAMGGGGALLATGVILFATSETDDGSKRTYLDTRPPGIALGLAGAAALGAGLYLWRRSRHESASSPTVAVDRHAFSIGWSRTF